mgnify:CR=1 FL=1
MADIKPFVCVRPAEDVVSAVAALPYDVYNREEAKEVVAKKSKNHFWQLTVRRHSFRMMWIPMMTEYMPKRHRC